MDITQLIADDHTEQRRLFSQIEQISSHDGAALHGVWARLRVLLDTHALAEERFFYPELLKIGRGADDESPTEETRDAIKDHNEISDIAAAELGGFEDRLSAPAAGRADSRVTPADDRDARNLVEAELVLRGGERALLCADAQPVAGVLHIGAGHHIAVDRFHRASDVE